MENSRIAFFDAKPYDIQFFDEANKSFNFDITYFEPRLVLPVASLAHGHTVACLAVHDFVDAEIAQALYDAGIRLLALRSNGYNHIDLQAAKPLFPVVRVPKYSPYAVAEFTIGLLLSLNRKIHLAYWRTKTNNFSLMHLMGFDMQGKTAGVIGTGYIGAIVAKLLKGFGMNVLAYDPHPNQDLLHSGTATYVSLETLCKQSDVITLHCPLTPANKYLISQQNISLMKDGVLLINTSRGGLILTADLIEGLKSGKLGAPH